jgi:hypothetical protein
MGDPGLLQKLPDIPSLLSEGGCDGEQACPADGAVGRQVTMADLAHPRHSLAALSTQLHHPLERGYRCAEVFDYNRQKDRLAAVLQGGQVDRFAFVAVLLRKELLLQLQQLHPFCDSDLLLSARPGKFASVASIQPSATNAPLLNSWVVARTTSASLAFLLSICHA